MKILQLCKKFPYPLKDGESIAVTTLGRSLKELGCEITLLAMNTHKHYYDISRLPENFDHYRRIHTEKIDNRIKPFDAFLNLFSPESYHIIRFISPVFKARLVQLLKSQTFDVIQLETLYLAPYIPVIRKYSDAIIAMRAHNVEHEIWQRIADNTRFFPKRWYLDHLTKKLKEYEISSLKSYDILVPITDRDLRTFRYMGHTKPSAVTPIGIDIDEYQPDYSSYQRELSISFIGSLDWMPNQEGLCWFLDNVWAKAVSRFPKLKLHIAGRNTPAWMHKLENSNLKVHGEVPDALDFINRHSIMIVPLLSGSGMRAKILEGMALGKTILTTQLGLEGIDARHRKEVLVADTVDDFLKNLQFCYEKGAKLEGIGRRAQTFVARQYDCYEIAHNLYKAYQSLMVEAI